MLAACARQGADVGATHDTLKLLQWQFLVATGAIYARRVAVGGRGDRNLSWGAPLRDAGGRGSGCAGRVPIVTS